MKVEPKSYKRVKQHAVPESDILTLDGTISELRSLVTHLQAKTVAFDYVFQNNLWSIEIPYSPKSRRHQKSHLSDCHQMLENILQQVKNMQTITKPYKDFEGAYKAGEK